MNKLIKEYAETSAKEFFDDEYSYTYSGTIEIFKQGYYSAIQDIKSAIENGNIDELLEEIKKFKPAEITKCSYCGLQDESKKTKVQGSFACAICAEAWSR